MHVTPFYAAALALLFIALSVRTLRLRRALRVGLGDQGEPQILRAMRVHANFTQYVPLTLVLTLMLELQGASAAPVHFLCACLVVGRISHALGVSREPEDYRFRVFGMAMTFTALGGAAVTLLLAPFLLPLLA